MNINISLSTESIASAIRRLTDFKEDFEDGIEKVVDVLTTEGSEVAGAAFGNWDAVVTPLVGGKQGVISADGYDIIIAEFGAGQATMPVMFENSPGVPVYEGSYSESPQGTGEYARFGSWHFGGRYYTEIPARHGMLNAKQYIIENSTQIAQGVFGND